MTAFDAVGKALAEGADPAMLCATCPWDRYCIMPPQMTRAEVDAKMREAEEKDRIETEKLKAEGKPPSMPVGMLLTAVITGGADTKATVCPVFAMRLRSSTGRNIVDTLKSSMQSWDDAS